MEGKKLTVKVKGTIVKNFVLADEYNITNTKYEETIDSMVNVVKIYDENKKQVGEVKTVIGSTNTEYTNRSIQKKRA